MDNLVPYSRSFGLGYGKRIDFERLHSYFNMAAQTVKNIVPGSKWDDLPDDITAAELRDYAGHPLLFKWLIDPADFAALVASYPVLAYGGKAVSTLPFVGRLGKLFSKVNVNFSDVAIGAALGMPIKVVTSSVDDRCQLLPDANNGFWYLSNEYLERELYVAYFDDGVFSGLTRIYDLDRMLEINPSFSRFDLIRR